MVSYREQIGDRLDVRDDRRPGLGAVGAPELVVEVEEQVAVRHLPVLRREARAREQVDRARPSGVPSVSQKLNSAQSVLTVNITRPRNAKNGASFGSNIPPGSVSSLRVPAAVPSVRQKLVVSTAGSQP